MKAVDLFAGPGGWDVATRRLGIDVTGIEHDPATCQTRRAAGHATVEGDVRHYGPGDFDWHAGLIGSPPCPTFSVAGKGSGRRDLEAVLLGVKHLAARQDISTLAFEDDRTPLVMEPLRWVLQAIDARLPYEWIALEQVPTVLPVWEAVAEMLRAEGYGVATGNLNAEQYGVPQTRRRAILVARYGGPAELPTPTHSRYYPRDPARLDPGVLPWLSMAEAIGWGFTDRPSTSLVSASGGGRRLLDSSSANWTAVAKAISNGRFIRAPHRQGHALNRGDLSTCPAEDGAALQTFPPGYPWQGGDTAAGKQIGNAVPPLLAEAILSRLTGRQAEL